MKIEFFGAAQTVTGSQHLITVNGRRILLDCGFYQGRRHNTYERNLNFPFNPRQIDTLILSHAHIDHSGNIPNLVKHGFQGDIVCTYATRDLCSIMLRDSGKIQESDVQHLNKQRKREKLPPVEPIYTIEDAVNSLRYFVGIGYERPFKLTDGVTLTFYDAGHILGSAMIKLDIEDHEEKEIYTLIFSGDIGRYNRPILADPTTFTEADLLIMESTYGSRDHALVEPDDQKLAAVVNRTVERGGKMIVPAFAVGRTQELVYRLAELMREGEIPRIPVYIDSPLAINATSIFRLHPEAYDAELAELIMQGDDPFASSSMNYTRTVAQSKRLNELADPAVIISASGMAENGRILHHLVQNIGDPKNTVMIVGWQAPHTLGRKLVEQHKNVKIFGKPFRRECEVVTLNGFSGHAGRSELLEWTAAFNRPPQQTFLVHGELDAAQSLRQGLYEQGFQKVEIPQLGQQYIID